MELDTKTHKQLRKLLELINGTFTEFRTELSNAKPDECTMDVLAVLNPNPAIRTDAEREQAARRLAAHFRKPIYRQRWRQIEAELRRRAERRGHAPTRELEDMIVTHLFEAVQQVKNLTPSDKVREKLLSALNRTLTLDLTNREMLHRETLSEEDGCPEAVLEEQINPLAVMEARLVAEALVRRAGLTKREAEVVAAIYANDNDKQAAASELGITATTLRVHWSNVVQKFRNAL